jgi:hypothetical protein
MRWQLFSERYLVVDRRVSAARTLAPGLVEAIVEGENPVKWDRLRACGMTDDELFALARADACAHAGEITTNVIDGISLSISTGAFLSAAMLRTLTGLAGGAIAVPVSRYHWCWHPLDDTTCDAHVQMMRFLAQALAGQLQIGAAEAIGIDVYKFVGAEVERVPATMDAMRLTGR